MRNGVLFWLGASLSVYLYFKRKKRGRLLALDNSKKIDIDLGGKTLRLFQSLRAPLSVSYCY